MGVAAPQAAHAGAMDIELHWTDATRAPLDNLVISGHLERPVENIPPLQVAFVAVGGGRYRSTVVLPERGAWDLYVTAARGSDSFEAAERSEEHTSELQSLMRISYAVFCLKKKK